MSVPTHIFIDTGVFHQAGFNFASPRVRPFHEALPKLGLTFLDPDPIARERSRHLRERVEEAIAALEQIEKSLPVITSLEQWPKGNWLRAWKIRRLMNESLAEFLKPMNHVKLGYDGIDMSRVMTWYDHGTAPFGKGKKSKEFPDALAVAILDRFSKSNGCEIAVISTDSDFERACSTRANLLYFPSLAAYLQVRQGESQRVETIQEWFENDETVFDDAITDIFTDFSFEIEEAWDGDVTDPQIDSISVTDLYVVAVADRECTVSFEAEVEFTVNVDYEDEDDYDYDRDGNPVGHPRKQGFSSSAAHPSVLAKLRLSDDRKEVEEITHMEFDIDSASVSVSDAW